MCNETYFQEKQLDNHIDSVINRIIYAFNDKGVYLVKLNINIFNVCFTIDNTFFSFYIIISWVQKYTLCIVWLLMS